MLKMVVAPVTARNRKNARMPDPPCCHGNSLGSSRKEGPSVKPRGRGWMILEGRKVGMGERGGVSL